MNTQQSSQARELYQKIASHYSLLAQVEAVAIAGSQITNTFDQRSDIDLYVYIQSDIPLHWRAAIMSNASDRELDNQFWEPGDEWIDADTNIHVDVMFRQVKWIEEKLDQVLNQHQAAIGYSTCFWHNVLHSCVLYDKAEWFHELQQIAEQPYPEGLRRAIVAKNYPLLRQNLSSYMHQLELAVERNDIVSLNHRMTAFLASYFDVLFALNRLPHPGEKRLIQIAEKRCHQKPEKMSAQISELISAVYNNPQRIVQQADELVDGLSQLLKIEGFRSE
jgi:predicted nucleotidyltransferase